MISKTIFHMKLASQKHSNVLSWKGKRLYEATYLNTFFFSGYISLSISHSKHSFRSSTLNGDLLLECLKYFSSFFCKTNHLLFQVCKIQQYIKSTIFKTDHFIFEFTSMYCLTLQAPKMKIQSNFNGLNTFGTMKTCSRLVRASGC